MSRLSFQVKKGEILGIAGPNGAGKTTLFNVITCFYHGSGEIIFDNHRIDRLRPDQIALLGIARTFQIPQLFDSMTIGQNVEVGAHFGARGSKNEEKIIGESLSFVGLSGKGEIPVAKLKLFDKKLTMIAAALATKPKLLLLDEPIAGLSPLEAEKFVEIIKKINTELDATSIIIEHLMSVLVDISQRLMILNNGQEICTGPPEEVCKNPEVIEALLGAANA